MTIPNEDELLGGGGEEQLGKVESEVQLDGEPEGGEKPALRVVEKPDAWKEGLPPELRDKVKTPEEAHKAIRGSMSVSREKFAADQAAERKRLREAEQQLSEAEFDTLVDEHDRELMAVAQQLGDAVKTPEGAELLRRTSLKILTKKVEGRFDKKLDQAFAAFQRGSVIRDREKDAWFNDPKNGDLEEFFPFIEQKCDHEGYDANAVAQTLRELMPIMRRGNRAEDDYGYELDRVSSISPVAKRVFSRSLRTSGLTEHNRSGNRRGTKEEEKQYKASHEALITSMFGARRKGQGSY